MPTVSMLASVADLAASQAAGAVSQLLPSGIILPFGGATPPAGWLFCNGQLVNRTTYSRLFAAIGTVHGSGDGSTTFHLPDLRGRFLRGTDTMSQNAVTTAAGRDLDRVGRLASNTGGNTGDAVGSVQTNATKTPNSTFTTAAQTTSVSGAKNQMNGGTGGMNSGRYHSHTTASRAYGYETFTYEGYGTGARNSTQGLVYPPTNTVDLEHGHSWDFGAATFSASGTTPASTVNGGGDNETRPLNANVNYIIKV